MEFLATRITHASWYLDGHGNDVIVRQATLKEPPGVIAEETPGGSCTVVTMDGEVTMPAIRRVLKLLHGGKVRVLLAKGERKLTQDTVAANFRN